MSLSDDKTNLFRQLQTGLPEEAGGSPPGDFNPLESHPDEMAILEELSAQDLQALAERIYRLLVQELRLDRERMKL